MAGFATVADLQARTKVVYAGADIDWVETLLDDASAHLRDILGWRVFPAAQVTYTTKVWAGAFHLLPIQPVVSVDSISIPDATALMYDVYDGGFATNCNGLATITFTAGYPTAPKSLVSWCCVLAAQAIEAVTKLGMLSNGGLSSVAIDDFKMVWSQSPETGLGGYTLPDRVVAQLRASYGTTVFVTGAQ
jgi:hypothetical protein